ncbi:hypothetical protein WMF11_25295 [Sorangium sp. So ce295]|uniref:hypothetical protein n=1 Tax=Sorangium sp. So ce295 TaxID=3133295 RepID=UPI003F63C806
MATDTVWTLEQLMVAALEEPAGEEPQPQPLAIPKPEGPARELPAGRGWLRVLPGGSAPSAPSAPQPPPVAPVATPTAVEPAGPPPESSRQLDLFAWRPRPRTPVQMSLFGDPPEE